MTMTTYLFGLWLILAGLAPHLPVSIRRNTQLGLLCAAPVLLVMSLFLQGWFPALMVLGGIITMEPGPIRHIGTSLRHRLHLTGPVSA